MNPNPDLRTRVRKNFSGSELKTKGLEQFDGNVCTPLWQARVGIVNKPVLAFGSRTLIQSSAGSAHMSYSLSSLKGVI